MKNNLNGIFREENTRAIKRIELIRWLIYIFFVDLIFPFINDPFSLIGFNFFFNDVFSIDEINAFIFFILIPLLLLYNYIIMSGWAYLEALFIYCLIDWFIEIFTIIFFEDFFSFFISILIFIEYFIFLFINEDDED